MLSASQAFPQTYCVNITKTLNVSGLPDISPKFVTQTLDQRWPIISLCSCSVWAHDAQRFSHRRSTLRLQADLPLLPETGGQTAGLVGWACRNEKGKGGRRRVTAGAVGAWLHDTHSADRVSRRMGEEQGRVQPRSR